MTKAERTDLLRARFQARCGWRQWQPTEPIKRKDPSTAPKSTCHRRWPEWRDTLIERHEPSVWVTVPEPAATSIIGTKRTKAANPVVRISEIFEEARINCLPLLEVSRASR